MKNRNWKRGLKIMGLSVTSILLVAVIGIFVASGIFSKPSYLEPWQESYSSKFDDPRIQLVAHGLLAANGHNMQPWIIRLDKEDSMVFYLYADSDRLTSEVDPFARQLMITQGTFLEYVNIAGDKIGYETNIEIFPQGEYDEQNLVESMKSTPVARITLSKTDPQNNPLYEYMFLQDTNRGAYTSTKLTSEQIKFLEDINTDPNISIKIFQDEENLNNLGSYAMQAANIEANVPRVMKESAVIFRANEYQKNEYRYGFSVEGQGTTGLMKHIMQGLLTLFPSINGEKSATNMYIQSAQTSVDNTPAYALIITNDNSRTNQVKSGMIYSNMILTAHQYGLVMQPLSQALQEYPEMKEPYENIHSDYAIEGEVIQMFVRMGTPTKEFPQSMRRDVMDLIR